MLDIKKAAYPADECSPVCHVLKKTLHLFSQDKAQCRPFSFLFHRHGPVCLSPLLVVPNAPMFPSLRDSNCFEARHTSWTLLRKRAVRRRHVPNFGHWPRFPEGSDFSSVTQIGVRVCDPQCASTG